MPIWWKYILKTFSCTFLLSFTLFLGVIVILNVKHILYSPSLSFVILQQSVNYLPHLLSTCALISSFYSYFTKGQNLEIFGYLASSLSPIRLLQPALYVGILLTLITHMLFEVTANKLPNNLNINPITVIQHLPLFKNSIINTDSDLLIAHKDSKSGNIILLLSDLPTLKNDNIHLNNFSIITNNNGPLIHSHELAHLKNSEFQSYFNTFEVPKVSLTKQIAFSLFPLFFTFLGAIFSFHHPKYAKNKNIFTVFVILLIYFLTIILEKSLQTDYLLFAPLSLIGIANLYQYHKIRAWPC